MGFSLGKTLGGALKGAVTGFAASGGNPIGAVAGGVLGAGSSYLDSYQDKKALDYQNKQNIKLWNMQNDYNNPKAQMQRYIDAGLNPNLIYTQQNTATDISSGSLGDRQSDTIGTALNSMQQRQQLLNMESSRNQMHAQTQLIGENILNARQNREIEQTLLPYRIDLLTEQARSARLNNTSPSFLGGIIGKQNASNVVSKIKGFFNYLGNLYHSDYAPGGRYYGN